MNTPAPNLMIASNVRLVMRLGEGGMGSVWMADHLTLHTRVVVKFMAHELAQNPEAVARFSREAEAAAQVRSPHVVQMFDHGVIEAGVPYIVMELLEGLDLRHHLHVVRHMPPSEVSTLVTQMGSALARAHMLGIIHRDIKPENVFLTDLGGDEMFVKLLDFGIARGRSERLTQVTRPGIIVGTPEYMSPERLVRPDAGGPAVDLWSLAAVAFEAITGGPPFPGETIAAITLQMHALKRPAPSTSVSDIPPALDAWFARAFAIDPEARFPDAKTMANAFAAAQQGSPIRRTRPPPEPVTRRTEQLRFDVSQPGVAIERVASVRRPLVRKHHAPLALFGALVVSLAVLLAVRGRSTPASDATAMPTLDVSVAAPAPTSSAVIEAVSVTTASTFDGSASATTAPMKTVEIASTTPTSKPAAKVSKKPPKAPAVFDDVQ